MNKPLALAAAAFAALVILGGCDASHLVYVQDTTLGIDASVSMEGPQKLNLGFARDVFALVPKKDRNDQAMSAAAFSSFSYEFLTEFSFNNFIATGLPAKQIAQDKDTLEKLKNLTYGASLQ
jgi:hypothetical protein